MELELNNGRSTQWIIMLPLKRKNEEDSSEQWWSNFYDILLSEKAKQVSRVLTLHKKKGNTRKYTNICLFVQKKFKKDKPAIKVIDSL